MKNLLVVLALFVFAPQLQAQSKLNLSIRVIDNQSKAVAGISVTLIETTSKKRINSKTNAVGVVSFELNYGNEWAVNISEMKN
jgi:hypothetical protein